jgi:hypothetical protein
MPQVFRNPGNRSAARADHFVDRDTEDPVLEDVLIEVAILTAFDEPGEVDEKHPQDCKAEDREDKPSDREMTSSKTPAPRTRHQGDGENRQRHFPSDRQAK